MAETTATTPDNITEVLQHRIVWWLSGDTPAPTELNQSQVEFLESQIKAGYNQGELFAHDNDGEWTHRGWWQIRNCA